MKRAIACVDQPGATFSALETLVDETIGVKLFTIMKIDRERNVARRIFTNRPDVYTINGEKPLELDRWSEHVELGQNMFVANSIEDIADVFSDHELIQSLGCESCLNIPIVIAGKVVGTLDCLHEAGHYTTERVASAESLKVPGALAFLIGSNA